MAVKDVVTSCRACAERRAAAAHNETILAKRYVSERDRKQGRRRRPTSFPRQDEEAKCRVLQAPQAHQTYQNHRQYLRKVRTETIVMLVYSKITIIIIIHAHGCLSP